jgi:hypothetical protein
VKAGDQVTAGQTIATVAASGTAAGGNAIAPHVHFQIQTQQTGGYVDPASFIEAARNRPIHETLPKPGVGQLQPRVPEEIRTKTEDQLEGGEPSRTAPLGSTAGDPNAPDVNANRGGTTPTGLEGFSDLAQGKQGDGLTDTATPAAAAEPSHDAPVRGFDASNYVAPKGDGSFVAVVRGQEKTFASQEAAEKDYNARVASTGGKPVPKNVTTSKSALDAWLEDSSVPTETKKAQLEVKLDEALDRIYEKRNSPKGKALLDEYNALPDNKAKSAWRKANPDKSAAIDQIYKYEDGQRAKPENKLGAAYIQFSGAERETFPDTRLARQQFVENILAGGDPFKGGGGGGVTVNIQEGRGGSSSGSSSSSSGGSSRSGGSSGNRAPAPVQRQQPTSPSGRYRTKTGVKTLEQMKAELSAANYPGPWDDAAVLAAYARTTGGEVVAEEAASTSTPTTTSSPTTTTASPAAPAAPTVDTAAERSAIRSLLPKVTPRLLANDGEMRTLWRQSRSRLTFGAWMTLLAEEYRNGGGGAGGLARSLGL